ncbi:MAG: TolC family protein [Thainema sp.]
MFYRLHWIALSLGAAIALDGSTAIALPSSSLSKQLESSTQESQSEPLPAPDATLFAKKGALLDSQRESQRSDAASEASNADDSDEQAIAQADSDTDLDSTESTESTEESTTDESIAEDSAEVDESPNASTDVDTEGANAAADESIDIEDAIAEGSTEAEESTEVDVETTDDDDELLIPEVDVEAEDDIDVEDLVPTVDEDIDDDFELEPLVDEINPPDYLNADPNPLLYPTQPEEVEIIGNQPITLEEAYAIALGNNRDLQRVQLELEQAEAALREAKADTLPTVQAESSFSASENTQESNPLFNTSSDDINLDLSGTVGLSYDLFTSGRRSSQIEAVETQVRISKLEVERIAEDTRFDVADRYYDLQLADEQVGIAAAFLDEALQSLRDAQIRERAGVGTRFDVLQAEVQVANARQELTQARSSQIISRRALAEILSIPSNLSPQSVAVEVVEDWPLSLEESIVLAFQNRAELQQFLLQREIAQEQRDIALSALGPQVSLFANYNINNRLNDESSGFRDQYTFGAQLNWLLFDGGAARARASQEDSNIEIAETQFADTLELIRLQVEQSFYDQQANQANIETAEIAVNQAREALRLARLRFQAGVGTQLEVINAQADLTQAEGNLVQAVIGYNRAIAALRRSISNLPETRLVDSLEIPPASEFVFPLELGE